jgi:predicted enzyme related to lactoylglutathione lyase
MPTTHGRFVWHDLSTTDPAAAQAFYTKVTPWKTQPSEVSGHYTLWVNDNTPIGGLTPLGNADQMQGLPPHWLAYVYVYDVDACVRQVPRLGGQVHVGPTEVPSVGCWAVLRDPQGATIGVYEPETPSTGRTAGPPRRGEFSWHELMTTDYKAAFEFYRALFQWEKMSEFDMGPMGGGIYFLYGQKGQTYGGMFNRRPEMPPPNWLSYVRVDDVKTVAQTVQQLNGKVLNGPMEVPGGDWIAQCMDPQGAAFAVHTPKV